MRKARAPRRPTFAPCKDQIIRQRALLRPCLGHLSEEGGAGCETRVNSHGSRLNSGPLPLAQKATEEAGRSDAKEKQHNRRIGDEYKAVLFQPVRIEATYPGQADCDDEAGDRDSEFRGEPDEAFLN